MASPIPDRPRSIEDWVEPIPGVLIHRDKCIRTELDRLFPSPFFDALRARYPGIFPSKVGPPCPPPS